MFYHALARPINWLVAHLRRSRNLFNENNHQTSEVIVLSDCFSTSYLYQQHSYLSRQYQLMMVPLEL